MVVVPSVDRLLDVVPVVAGPVGVVLVALAVAPEADAARSGELPVDAAGDELARGAASAARLVLAGRLRRVVLDGEDLAVDFVVQRDRQIGVLGALDVHDATALAEPLDFRADRKVLVAVFAGSGVLRLHRLSFRLSRSFFRAAVRSSYSLSVMRPARSSRFKM